MALVKATLKAEIYKAFNDEKQSDDPTVDSIDRIADRIATAIDDYIKSASIIAPAGIAVSTSGTAAAQTGATTAPSSECIIS